MLPDFLVLVQKPGCLTASPLCIRPCQVSPALMHLLKAWLFINFLFTIFRYTPGLGNDQSCFFHVALLFLFSSMNMKTHGVGIGLTPGNLCFRLIYLYELFSGLSFLLFWTKLLTLKTPDPFFLPYWLTKIQQNFSIYRHVWLTWVLLIPMGMFTKTSPFSIIACITCIIVYYLYTCLIFFLLLLMTLLNANVLERNKNTMLW